jgi:hypothetical protein
MIGLTADNPLALAWSLFPADAQDGESDRGDHFAAFCPHKDACLFPVSRRWTPTSKREGV